jgi:hypothetical protein
MRGIILVVGGIAVYLAPTFIAMYRNKINYFRIFIINFALGWTVLAWIYCLIESLKRDPIAVDMDEMIRKSQAGTHEVTVNLETGEVKATEIKKENVDGLSTKSEVSGESIKSS